MGRQSWCHGTEDVAGAAEPPTWGQDAEEIQTYIHAITKLHHPTAEKEKS